MNNVIVQRKLNLGCGNNLIDGWDNVDPKPQRPKDGVRFFICDLLRLREMYHDEIASEIIVNRCAVSNPAEYLRLLADCSKLLVPGGYITVHYNNPTDGLLVSLQKIGLDIVTVFDDKIVGRKLERTAVDGYQKPPLVQTYN